MLCRLKLAWKRRTAPARGFVFSKRAGHYSQMNSFQFFLMTMVVYLGPCWNYPCFKGKLAFTLMNGLDCRCSPAFFNSFFKQINQVKIQWMCCSTGAFPGVLLNIKPTHTNTHTPTDSYTTTHKEKTIPIKRRINHSESAGQ